jgi:hypothetical protein
LLAAAVIVFVLWATVANLQTSEALLNFRYKNAFPVAISDLRGRKHDYAAYLEVAAPLLNGVPGETPENAPRIRLETALSVPINNPERLWFISGDDKGLVDLVYLAFLLFGPAVSSIFKMVALLLVTSISLYAAEFCDSGPRMALLLSVLASLYAMLFTFGISDQSSSIIEPRFLGFLSVVALLHLSLLIIDGRRLSKKSVILAGAQAVLLSFVVHLRSSELWQYLCIAGIGMIAIGLRGGRLRREQMLVPVLLLTTFFCLTLYRTLAYNEYYFKNDVSARIFWHTALTGLGVNPELRKRYGLDVLDDGAALKAVDRYLQSSGQDEVRERLLLSNPNYTEGGYDGFNWSTYEIAARELYFHILAQNPLTVLSTYLIFMPRTFIANIYYMATGKTFDDFLFPVGKVEGLSIRETRDLYLIPFRVLPVMTLFVAGIVLALSRSPIVDPACFAASGAMVLTSMIPTFLITPVMHYIQVTVLLILSVGYFAVIVLFALVIRRLVELLRSFSSAKSSRFLD